MSIDPQRESKNVPSNERHELWIRIRLLVGFIFVVTTFAVPISNVLKMASAAANSLQMSSNSSATGWYPNEPGLSPAKVKNHNFGELFDTQLNGAIFAQPLVSQSTVLTVTENDYVYGLNARTGSIKWMDDLGPPADPQVQIGCPATGVHMGITGTPVIDPVSDVAYFVAGKDTGMKGSTQWFMEAVNVKGGEVAKGWPKAGIQIEGSADGDPDTVFNGQFEMQRPGLVLVHGVVYAAFGAMCDLGSWEGWLVGVSESRAKITTMWSSEEHVSDSGLRQPGGGIWQSGSPPVVNGQGDIFVATGNGDVPAKPVAGNRQNVNQYGEGVIELSTSGGTLHPIDFFIADDARALNRQDGDLGSGSPVSLPASMGTKKNPTVMLIDGKQGILYVLDEKKLGGYQQGTRGTDDVLSEVGPFGGVWAKPAVWPGSGGYVYIPTAGTANSPVHGRFSFLTNGGSLLALKRTVGLSGNISFNLEGATANSGNVFGFGSGSPIVTSNGTKDGSALVWIIHASDTGELGSQLEAYDPIPVNKSLEEVWSSAPFTSTKFSQPVVDNGVVYVGTQDSTILGFGTLPPKAPALVGANLSFPPTTISQSVTRNATFTAHVPTTVSSFTISSNYSTYSLGTPSVPLPASLVSGESITVPITFTPTALGSNQGTVTANVIGAASEITLSGQGETPTASFTISPDQIIFPASLIGGPASTPKRVTFTNVSSSAIKVTGFTSPILPFKVTNPPANQIMRADGGKFSFNIVFYPPASSGDFVQVFNGVATVDTSAGSFGVAISGSANPRSNISIAPDVLNFGRVAIGSSVTLHFDLGDQGALPLRIIRSVPPKSRGFRALTNPFTQLKETKPKDTIAPNASMEETVRFAPSQSGYVSATWLLEGNDGNGVQKILIMGTGFRR
jgi:hypothetical protein